MAEKETVSFITKYKMYIIAVAILLASIVLVSVFSGNPSISTTGAVNASKKASATNGNDNVQLEGISVGGNFNLDKSSNKSSTSNDNKNTSTSTTTEGNEKSQ